jgi:hyperosmotically inducible protein
MHKHFSTFSTGILALLIAAACNTAPEPEPTPRLTNDELDRTVVARINSDAALARYNLDIDADADKNAVTLSGSVPTQNLRERAVEAAKAAVPGIVITDKIDVKPGDVDRNDFDDEMASDARARAKERGDTVGNSLDDAWVHTKVRAKLMADGDLPDSDINVDVANNVVTLRGNVATQADKTEAEQLAKSIEGVKSIRNRLTIKPAR